MTIFYFPECPHCRNAFMWQEELFREHPEYREIDITFIDEKREPETADKYDYWYVPTYYLDGVKCFEGVTERDKVAEAFRLAYEG